MTVDAAQTSLFERLGGDAAIQAAVVDFYERVLGDETLAPFFGGLDVAAQIQKQVAFMTMAFGGPHRYSGRDLTTAHAKLVRNGLGDAQFDRVAKHLAASLESLGVETPLINEVLATVAGTRTAVLGRNPA